LVEQMGFEPTTYALRKHDIPFVCSFIA